MSNLTVKAINGAKWTGLSTLFGAVLGIVKTAILARYLNAGDFGLMALVMFVMGFMDLFMDMGISSAILHKRDVTRNEYSSLFWINVIFSLLIFLCVCGMASAIGNFYQESELSMMIPIMGSSVLISAFGRQYKTIAQKELRFRFISGLEILGQILGFCTTTFFAVEGYGAYSLIYGSLFQYAITNGFFFIDGVRRNRLQMHLRFQETKNFLSIGIYQVGGQVINYFSRDIDVLLVGKAFGSEVLGGYSLAKQLVQRPNQMISPIIMHVGAPLMSKIQSDIQQLKESFLKLLKIVSTVNFISYGFLAVFANPIALLIYGSEFVHIVELIRILSVFMFIRSIMSPVGTLITATGKTFLDFYWNLFVFIVSPIGIGLGALVSVEMVAFSLVVVLALILYPFWKLLVYRLCGATWVEFITSYIPDFRVFSFVRSVKFNRL